jgi:hypothetical protein
MNWDAEDIAIMMCDMVAGHEDTSQVAPYKDSGVMTNDAGFTITMSDGTEFQVTVVQSK